MILENISTIRKSIERKAYVKMVQTDYKNFYSRIYKNLNIQNLSRSKSDEAAWLEYWDGFGVKPNVRQYRLFANYVGNDTRIVPEDICRVAIEPVLNSPRYRKFWADKNLWDKLVQDANFPKTVIRCIEGAYYDSSYKKIDANDGYLDDILKNSGKGDYIVKPTRDSNSGQGVYVIENQKRGVFLIDGDRLSLRKIERLVGKNYIIQPFEKQHVSISRFCSSSLCPIRICTYKSVKDDKVYVLNGSVLRIGYAGEHTDGTHGNGVFIGIKNDGSLMSNAVDYLGNIYKEFNGIDFSNEYKIDGFEAAKELAIKVAKQVTYNRLLAFDIMIDEGGNPKTIEFNNDGYSMWLAQFVGKPAFGEYTDEILNYVRENLSNIEYVRYY